MSSTSTSFITNRKRGTRRVKGTRGRARRAHAPRGACKRGLEPALREAPRHELVEEGALGDGEAGGGGDGRHRDAAVDELGARRQSHATLLLVLYGSVLYG